MSQHIPEESIQEVLLRTDIAEVIGEYVLLKKSGANLKGLCPFHTEKTPSFTVSSTKGLFYCFGCQAHGNVLRFLMQHEALSFPDAVHWLAARYGVRILDAGTARQSDTLNPLYLLHRAATTFFHNTLRRDPAAQAGRAYCQQRHVTQDMATRFELGYAPDAWEALSQALQRQGFSQELLVQSGLVVVRDPQRQVYDRFRHRLIFPIHDRLGRPVAFGGRTLEEQAAVHVPKYLNSPETPIFHKSRILYGFHLAKQVIRQQEQAIIVEGYTDVLACHRQEVTHVVGTLGTALTEHHVALLKGCAKEVVLVFDSDTAGGAAAERSIGLFLDAGIRVRVAQLPESEDPDSFLQHHSGADFLRYVDTAVTFLEYLLTRVTRFSDIQTPTGQADCVARIVPLLRKVDNQVEQWRYVAMLAEKIGVPPNVLGREMSRRTGARAATASAVAAKSSDSPLRASRRWPAEEYDLLHLLGHDIRWLDRVRSHVQAEHFQDADLREIYTLLIQKAPHYEQTVFPHILQDVTTPVQEQILTEMAMKKVIDDLDGRPKVLCDYINKMRRQSIRAQQQRLRKRLDTANDMAEQQHLLQECDRLGKEIQAAYALSEL